MSVAEFGTQVYLYIILYLLFPYYIIFIDLLEELISSRRLKGSLSGNKTTYTPDVYSDAQASWVKNFYTQNGYLGMLASQTNWLNGKKNTL